MRVCDDVRLHLNRSKQITVNNRCLSSFVVFFFFTAVSVCVYPCVCAHICACVWVCVCVGGCVGRCSCVTTNWIKKELTVALNFSKVHTVLQ